MRLLRFSVLAMLTVVALSWHFAGDAEAGASGDGCIPPPQQTPPLFSPAGTDATTVTTIDASCSPVTITPLPGGGELVLTCTSTTRNTCRVTVVTPNGQTAAPPVAPPSAPTP